MYSLELLMIDGKTVLNV